MNDTGYLAIVDTGRSELRSRIDDMRQRFYRLALSADPHARVSPAHWTVHEIVAHVLSVAHRYKTFIETGDFRRATDPAHLNRLNQEEMEAAMAPIPELVKALQALDPVMDDWFDNLTDDFTAEFHFGVEISPIVAQINWLGELVLHGEDIARAIGVPWQISERDMLFYLHEAAAVVPAYVRPEMARDNDICVALQIPDARPFVIHVHDGTVEMRARRPSDRPDAVLKGPASTIVRMLMGRIGPVTALRRGLRIVGGRQPWKVMKLQSCFVTA
jgi:uncharacterized protein (TIGR03083 family)